MTNSTTKPQGAIGTLVCIYALLVMLPFFLAIQCVITMLLLIAEGFTDLAERIERAACWVLERGPRLDRHNRI